MVVCCASFLAVKRGSQNKFADASKVLYGEQLKHSVKDSPNQFVTLNGVNGTHVPANGTMSSVQSQRMSLNINPLNELDESYANNTLHGNDHMVSVQITISFFL